MKKKLKTQRIRGFARVTLMFVLVAVPISDIFAARDISQEALLVKMEADTAPFILDVRTPKEYQGGHVPGAVNIDHRQLRDRLTELSENKTSEIVVYCEGGVRAAKASKVLEQAGFTNVNHLVGDMRAWRDSALPVE